MRDVFIPPHHPFGDGSDSLKVDVENTQMSCLCMKSRDINYCESIREIS